MDSLRNLRTSLPRTPASTASPHELLSAFKAAALSVTNLYKTAASDQARSKAEGYQQALDELLTFLDRENLGLGVDGEGWRVRQWATERYHGNGLGHSDDEDERDEAQPESRHASPEVSRKQDQPEQVAEAPVTALPQETVEDEVRVEAISVPQPQSADMFTFRSSYTYPSGNHDRDTEMDATNPASDSPTTTTTTANQAAMTMNMPRPRIERHTRHSHRHTGSGARNTSNATNLGNGAGSKRKMPDFFDISGFGGFGNGFGSNPGGKDFDRPSGGGKRGRHA